MKKLELMNYINYYQMNMKYLFLEIIMMKIMNILQILKLKNYILKMMK